MKDEFWYWKTQRKKKESNETELEESINIEITEGVMDDMTIKDWVNIQEMPGFNYTDYLVAILKTIDKDEFKDLKGITESDIENGLLTESQIKKLKVILKDGFKENWSVKEIEKQLDKNINFKDRITDTSTILAVNRPNMIARTETVRLANEGLLDLYKDNKIEKVRWLSAISNRTCDLCDAENGNVYTIEESYGKIPKHVNCRCTWLSILE